MKSLGAFDESSADRALAKCECHSCDLEANKFVDGRQLGSNSAELGEQTGVPVPLNRAVTDILSYVDGKKTK